MSTHASSSPITVEWRNGGVWLPELNFALDSSRSETRAFVSHAHSDHFARHREIVCSEPTADLIRARYGAPKSKITALPWDTPHFIDDWEIRLHPAGHILGSAMIHLRRPSDGATLLYTGDFKTRPGLASEVCTPVPADTLIMETTFGLPKYTLPPSEEVHDSIRSFAQSTLDADLTPIILAYSLGKAQEAHCALAELDAPIMLHPAAEKMSAVYINHFDHYPAHIPFDPTQTTGHILIAPPHIAKKPPLSTIPNQRSAILSGWALDSSAKYRYRTDDAFPLSDHADFPDLLAFVESVNPSLTYTLHGSSKEFASTLRTRGRKAWCIHGNDQLDLLF